MGTACLAHANQVRRAQAILQINFLLQLLTTFILDHTCAETTYWSGTEPMLVSYTVALRRQEYGRAPCRLAVSEVFKDAREDPCTDFPTLPMLMHSSCLNNTMLFPPKASGVIPTCPLPVRHFTLFGQQTTELGGHVEMSHGASQGLIFSFAFDLLWYRTEDSSPVQVVSYSQDISVRRWMR